MMSEEHHKLTLYELAHRSLAQVIVETGILVLIALTALVGNSCVLYVFYKSPRLRYVTSYYLIVLAVSDVTLAVVVMPTAIVGTACSKDIIGRRFGEAIQWIYSELVLSSAQTTALIAINRFFCMVQPSIYRKYFKPKPAVLMIVAAWVFPLLLITAIYLSDFTAFQFYSGRFMYFPAFKSLTVARFMAALYQILFVVAPLLVTVFCYWKIYRVVTGHNAAVSSTLNAGPAANNSPMTREEIHITKSVLPLVCGFVICWIPCGTVYHVSTYVDIPRSAELFITYSAYASSAINPFVFYFFNNPFKKTVCQTAHSRKNKILICG